MRHTEATAAPAPAQLTAVGPTIELSPAVRFAGVTKRFGGTEVLRSFNLAVPPGQRLAIIGRSGSGKTTLLRLIMTLERPDAGTIEIDGDLLGQRRVGNRLIRDRTAHLRQIRAKIGMVFQHFNLFPHMTALGNVIEAPIHVLGKKRTEAEEDGLALLARVGLKDKARAYPRELSGGQQQRVAIARALALHPKIMLFDEVTSALDPELVGEVLNVIRGLANERQMTMLIVTHEMQFARDVSDRVIFIDRGQIVEDAPPAAIFSEPRHDETRAFLRAVLER